MVIFTKIIIIFQKLFSQCTLSRIGRFLSSRFMRVTNYIYVCVGAEEARDIAVYLSHCLCNTYCQSFRLSIEFEESRERSADSR